MVMAALVGDGLSFAFWSFSNQSAAPVVSDSLERVVVCQKVLSGNRRYGSTSVALTVIDSAGQTATVRKNITVNWDTGTLQY